MNHNWFHNLTNALTNALKVSGLAALLLAGTLPAAPIVFHAVGGALAGIGAGVGIATATGLFGWACACAFHRW